MTFRRPSPRIACPIGIFEGCETKIERLTAALNQTVAPEEKARLARDLLEELSTLLDCSAYDQNNINCRLCRNFSSLRRKTAAVIEKAAALGR